VHLHGEVCVHDNVHVTFHFPLPLYFSLPSAFGYSSNRFPLSQTANDDNDKDYHNNDNNCCNISRLLSHEDGTGLNPFPTVTGLQPPFCTIHVHYTAVPSGAAFPQIPVSLSTETAAFAQISETGDAQYPCGDASLRCVDLSEVCLFYRSCQAYGYASFIGFMISMCSFRAFSLSGFQRVGQVYCSGFNGEYGFF